MLLAIIQSIVLAIFVAIWAMNFLTDWGFESLSKSQALAAALGLAAIVGVLNAFAVAKGWAWFFFIPAIAISVLQLVLYEDHAKNVFITLLVGQFAGSFVAFIRNLVSGAEFNWKPVLISALIEIVLFIGTSLFSWCQDKWDES